ncbi:MAG: MotA/TolQ/ExbB proton channel family protein [Syntrophaceae bacterium]|nr:MotA/TolQ/ExbB proton channel family protein [Syntrophaceae bacterium]
MAGQIVTSLIVISGILFLAFNIPIGKMGVIANINALLIVLGGTISATLLVYPWKRLLWTAALIKKAFANQDRTGETIETIVTMARTYRISGIRALEKVGDNLGDGLLKTGIELIAYQYSKDKVEQILAKEALLDYRQYDTAYKMLYNMAKAAPALGLVGTIVNLIRIFGNINDSQSLIGYMAVALLSTFYGVVLANLVFVPLSHKIKDSMEQEQVRLELIQEGILDIYDQENPQAIKCKLEALCAASTFAAPSRATAIRPKTTEQHQQAYSRI